MAVCIISFPPRYGPPCAQMFSCACLPACLPAYSVPTWPSALSVLPFPSAFLSALSHSAHLICLASEDGRSRLLSVPMSPVPSANVGRAQRVFQCIVRFSLVPEE